jgi:hypothetical protein
MLVVKYLFAEINSCGNWRGINYSGHGTAFSACEANDWYGVRAFDNWLYQFIHVIQRVGNHKIQKE